MDFPIFHLDFLGNRLLIAITAIVHVIINHPMAVGAIPLATLLEWRAHKKRDAGLDSLAYKITFVVFIITTSVGAMTGVGIWFTTSLVNPDAIGSLLRVFFWGWFTEWIVFVLEVVFIMIYFLTWKSMTGDRKPKHIRIGLTLSILSWVTMAIITGILGFMMNPGDWMPFYKQWSAQSGLVNAFFNPLYLPQLAFRTPFALMSAGLFFMFLVPFFTKKGQPARSVTLKLLGIWTVSLLPLTAIAGIWYWNSIPPFMANQAPVALTTQAFSQWYNTVLILLVTMVVLILSISLISILIPRRISQLGLIIPFLAAVTLLGYFERVREFVRKPYVIKDYMYANGFRVQDYPLFKEDGILPHATFVENHTVTQENKLDAGRDVFMLTCTRCHTLSGVNSVLDKFDILFPDQRWQENQVAAYIRNMHNVRVFMPPFPGNDAELNALTSFLIAEQHLKSRISGAQSGGAKDFIIQ